MRAVGDAGPYGVRPSGCGIAPPEAWKRNDAGRRGRRPLRRIRREYADIRRCADAGTIMAQGTINVARGSDSDASLKTADAICAHHRAGRGSGSGDGSRGDSMWAFLWGGCKRMEGNPKTIGFWRRSFPYFFRC